MKGKEDAIQKNVIYNCKFSAQQRSKLYFFNFIFCLFYFFEIDHFCIESNKHVFEFTS